MLEEPDTSSEVLRLCTEILDDLQRHRRVMDDLDWQVVEVKLQLISMERRLSSNAWPMIERPI